MVVCNSAVRVSTAITEYSSKAGKVLRTRERIQEKGTNGKQGPTIPDSQPSCPRVRQWTEGAFPL